MAAIDVEMAKDIARVNPELLQIAEVSPSAMKENPHLVEQLYSQWLSLPDTYKLVKSLVDKSKNGSVPIEIINNSSSPKAGSPSSMFPAGSAPPLSPRSSSFSRRGSGASSARFSKSSPLKVVSEPIKQLVIPQFYFQNGRPAPISVKEECLTAINEIFTGHEEGMKILDFKTVTNEICKLPSFFSTVLFKKIDTESHGVISRDEFIDYWINKNMITMDTATQIYTILKQPNNIFLTQEDFKPVIKELLLTHPGLEFLQNTPEFQERYTETVIYRIFFYMNRAGNGRLTLRELKRSNLISAMQQTDEEEDINKILRYFSYEHFYVIYCKFWELDTDHDFLITKENLIKYGNHALTFRIVDRIFSQVPRKFMSKVDGKMCYEDYVYFILAEEDKSSEPSLEYWFKCVDLDGNGILTRNEMQYFYEEQFHRMECMTQEPVLFEDILCQLIDMICPQNEGCFLTLKDLKGCKLAGHVFNILFNLNKFMAFESRDPFLIRQEREEPTLTDWDRFARREYIRLSMEEDADDGSNGSGDVWDDSLDNSF